MDKREGDGSERNVLSKIYRPWWWLSMGLKDNAVSGWRTTFRFLVLCSWRDHCALYWEREPGRGQPGRRSGKLAFRHVSLGALWEIQRRWVGSWIIGQSVCLWTMLWPRDAMSKRQELPCQGVGWVVPTCTEAQVQGYGSVSKDVVMIVINAVLPHFVLIPWQLKFTEYLLCDRHMDYLI